MSGREEPGAVFWALADPTRREVMRRLSDIGTGTATELAGDLPISRQAVTKHLEALESAGLVAAERHGRERRFRLTPGPLTDAVSWMTSVGSQWDERLESLRSHLRPDAGAREPAGPSGAAPRTSAPTARERGTD
jgi:ArsR family transcriptional regulator, cadmium/lead-responsive transcriptional repressor